MAKFRVHVIRLLPIRLEFRSPVYAYIQIESLDPEQYGYMYRNPSRSRSLEIIDERVKPSNRYGANLRKRFFNLLQKLIYLVSLGRRFILAIAQAYLI